MIGRIKKKINDLQQVKRLRMLKETLVAPHLRASVKSRELSKRQDNLANISKGDVLLICTLRNEANRLPYFLEFYRKTGVNHFIFLDNNSTDDFSKLVSDQGDVSVFKANGSYKASHFGIDWVNWVLRKYCVGHWCLTVDPDEFLVYSQSETQNLNRLIEHLEVSGLTRLHSMLLDMYSDQPLSATTYHRGQDPIEICPHFDGSGYSQEKNHYLKNQWIQGGPRKRMLADEVKSAAPALNKVPLVKWQRAFCYLSSTHAMAPRYMNERADPPVEPTSCLLHFKFIAEITVKATEELAREQHYAGGREYHEYLKFAKNEATLIYEGSEKYTGTKQLEELGLISPISFLSLP